MIVTVTPNPCIDRTIRLERLIPGGLKRAHSATSEAAGKGVNVSHALVTEGIETVAVLPLAAQSAVQYLGLLADHYNYELPTRHISELTPPQIAAMPAEMRPDVMRLRAEYAVVMQSQIDAEPRHPPVGRIGEDDRTVGGGAAADLHSQLLQSLEGIEPRLG